MISDVFPKNSYIGNDCATSFDFDFYIENVNQLDVYHFDKFGTKNKLKHNVDYTINELKNENGSYITFPIEGSQYAILSEGERISLELTLPISQETEYNNSSLLNLKTLEYSFDYLTRLIQILSKRIDSCIEVGDYTSENITELIQQIINSSQSANRAWENIQEFGLRPATKDEAGIVKAGEGINIDENGTISIEKSADLSLQNLSTIGNARLQYAPFAINKGTVLNGNNNTLSYSGVNITCDPCTITTADGRTKVFDSAVTIDVSEELISSDIEFVQPIATNYYDGDIKKAFGEIGNNQTFAVGLSSNITIPATASSLDKGFNNDTSNWFNLKLTTLANLANKEYYIIFSNPSPLKLSSISFSERSGFVLTEGILEGSNDQQTWVELATISRTTSSNVETVNINSQAYYKYFRLIILRTGYSSDYIFYYDASQITFNGVYRSSDGNYKIFKDYETGELVLSKQFVYSATEPQSPSDNDLWLDIATMPANLYEYNSNDDEWNIINDLVYIGDCAVIGGSVNTLTNRYFNACPYHRDLVENYQNGESWYAVYSDGWCVQGGTTANSTSKTIEVNFLKSFKNTSYNVQAIINTSYIGTWYQTQVTAKELNHMELANNNTTDRSIMWQACGYIF